MLRPAHEQTGPTGEDNCLPDHEARDQGPSHAGEGSTAQKAASLVTEREPPTPREDWQKRLGTLLGGKLYDAIVPHASAAAFMKMGDQAVNGALKSIAGRLAQAIQSKGLAVGGSGMKDLLTDEIKAQLAPIATEFLHSTAGQKIAAVLADFVEDSPLLVVCSMILAAAGAVLADLDIPQLKTKIGLGGGLSITLIAKLGSLRNISADRIGVELAYAKDRFTSKLIVARIDDAEQQKVTDQLATGDMPLPVGTFDRDAPLYNLRSDIVYKLNSKSNTTASMSNEGWIQNGQFLSGKISANLKLDASSHTHLDFGVQQNYGVTSSGQATSSANYSPNKNTTMSLGISQGFGPDNAGTGVSFSLQLRDRFTFKGHYDSNGAWAGLVIRIP